MTDSTNPKGPVDSGLDAGKTFIVFRAADNLFGVNIESIREVIEPVHITRVPLMSDVIKGIINIRGVIVPTLDMCKRLYDAEIKMSQNSRIFICETKEGSETSLLGGLVDEVVSVNDMSDMELSDSPEFGSKMRADFIKCVGKVNNHFVMLLDMARVFDINDLALHALKNAYQEKSLDFGSRPYDEEAMKGILKTQEQEESASKTHYILFALNNEKYGIDMGRVLEVVRIENMERLPNAMTFMKGIMNIRNNPVPLIDMRLRCGLPEKTYTSDTAVLIVNTGGIPVGLIVDSVSDVMEISEESVKDTLHYSVQIERDFISGIAELDGKFIVLVNVDRILTDDELENLKRMEDEAAVDQA
jgi:purine-binding chemotaxis protein CheW